MSSWFYSHYLCILPFILLIASSFSSEADLTKYGYSFIPRGFTLAAYKYIWAIKENILRAYGMSFLITGIGTVINLVMTLLFAYPLSRKKTFLGGNGFPFSCSLQCFSMVVFVPTYLIYSNVFHITDTLAAMIVPYLFNECVLCYHDAYLYYDKRSNGSYRGIHD